MSTAEIAVRKWLEEVVIGLNLCPFAARPNKRGQIRIVVVRPENEDALISALQGELERLDASPPEALETTLLAIDGLLGDFDDYTRFVDFAEVLVRQFGWEGIYQVASFHPDYRFAGSEPDDDENLTNRSPCPLLHLIREASIEAALERFPDPDSIPDKNIRRVSALDADQRRRLFPYLFAG